MLEVLQFIFSGFWTFIGALLLIWTVGWVVVLVSVTLWPKR